MFTHSLMNESSNKTFHSQLKSSLLAYAAVALLSLCWLAAPAQAEDSPIGGYWEVTSGGSGRIYIDASTTAPWTGTPATVISFSDCPHEAGETTWIIAHQTSLSTYVGQHLYYEDDCSVEGYGEANWRLSGPDLSQMQACSTGPTGSSGCSDLKRVDGPCTAPCDGSGYGDPGSPPPGSPPGEVPTPTPPSSDPPTPPTADDTPWPFNLLEELSDKAYDLVKDWATNGKATIPYGVDRLADMRLSLKINDRRKQIVVSERLKIKGVQSGNHKATFRFDRSERKKLRRLAKLARSKKAKQKLDMVLTLTAIGSDGRSNVIKKRYL